MVSSRVSASAPTTKLDTIAYQGLATSINQSSLPYVLPRYEYSFFADQDPLGGRFRFDTTDFNIIREKGTNTQRAAARLDWQRPFTGALGEKYKITIHSDLAAYEATSLDQTPTYGTEGSVTTVRAQPTIAAECAGRSYAATTRPGRRSSSRSCN